MLLAAGHHLQYKYENQIEDLLDGLTFRIDSNSRIGLVGPNGCGKTTLVKLLIGQLQPVSGHIQKVEGLKIGFLSQSFENEEHQSGLDYIYKSRPDLYNVRSQMTCESNWKAIEKFDQMGGYLFETQIEKHRDLVSLSKQTLLQPFHQLSGGEKTKIALLSIYLQEPDLLVLDEPTNHLDFSTVNWLEEFLQSVDWPFLLVSHDRRFLDRLTNETWELKAGEFNQFSGNYSHMKKEKEERRAYEQKKFELHQKKVKQLKLAAQKRRIEANRMENFKPKRSIKKNGGLCKIDDGSGSHKADPTKKMRAAKAVEKRIEKLLESEHSNKPLFEKNKFLSMPIQEACKSKNVFQAKDLRIDYEFKKCFANLSISLCNRERIAIVGPNGCGKTTLLKALYGQLSLQNGEILWAPTACKQYFSQESRPLDSAKDDLSILNYVWQPDVCNESHAREILANFGFTAISIRKNVHLLSPGEKTKVELAKIILSGANVLLLDEPTNHLELQTRELLGELLKNYQGSVVFVSHDRQFIDDIATDVFDMQSA